MGVPANDDGFGPAWHKARDILADDGLPEHGASQDVPDGAVGRSPHLLELELLHAFLIRSDGGTLDAHVVFLHRSGRVHGHLVVCGVSVLDAQVVAAQDDGRYGTVRLMLYLEFRTFRFLVFKVWVLYLAF